MKYLISAHYSSPIEFNGKDCERLIADIYSGDWDNSPEDGVFLTNLYKRFYEIGIIPENVNL